MGQRTQLFGQGNRGKGENGRYGHKVVTFTFQFLTALT
jgi:hypothetical protein